MTKAEESVTIKQVANGWLVTGKSAADVLHVSVTAAGLAEYVGRWASGSESDDRPKVTAPPNGVLTVAPVAKGA